MTALYAVIAMALAAGCLTLTFHPLLRFLKLSEVPAALFIACTGRLNRRRLAFILRSRREGYLEALEGVPPSHVLAWQYLAVRWDAVARFARRRWALAAARSWAGPPAVPPEKRLAVGRYPVPSREHVARALDLNSRSVSSVRGIGHRAQVVICRETDDWRDRLPVGRNPWSALVEGELDRHREDARWANVERNWRDIR